MPFDFKNCTEEELWKYVGEHLSKNGFDAFYKTQQTEAQTQFETTHLTCIPVIIIIHWASFRNAKEESIS